MRIGRGPPFAGGGTTAAAIAALVGAGVVVSDGATLTAVTGGSNDVTLTAGVVTVNGLSAATVTVGASTVLNKATGNAHTFSVNAVACLTVGATYATIGAVASAAAAGSIRLPRANVLMACLKADGTTDMPLLQTDSSNNLTIGSATSANAPTNVTCEVASGGIFQVRVTGSPNQVFAVGGTGTTPFMKLGNSSLASTGTIRGQQAFTLYVRNNADNADQAVFAKSTDGFVWGDVVCTSQTFNCITTTGTHTFQVGGVQVGMLGLTYFTVGATNVATGGDIRLAAPAGNRTLVQVPNAANSAQIHALSLSTANVLRVGADSAGANSNATLHLFSSGTMTLYAGSTASNVSIGFTTSQFFVGEAQSSPIWSHALRTTDVATTNLVLRAQGAYSSAATNVNGGALLVQGGVAKTDGTTGLRKGVRLELSSGNVTMLEATEVVVAQRIVALCRGSAITTTECPTGAPDLGMYWGNAATVPTVAPVSGCYAYSNVGPYAMHTTGQHQSMTPKYGTRAWPSDANYTAVAADYTNTMLNMTGGLLSTTRDLIVPLVAGYVWTIINNTTGSVTPQSIRVIGASGTGVTIVTATTAIVYCDGTNIVRASPV